jgi:uncharacterized protein YdaU (DUF1376 family)
MAEFPALPLWTDAYLGDTTHLTTIEHGAYLLLLMTAWRTRDCRLPDDDKLLARYARCNAGQWKRLRPILEPFFVVENGQWWQRRLTDEASAVRQRKESAAANGRASALKRKGRHSTEREQSVNETPAKRQRESNLTSNQYQVPLDKSNGAAPSSDKHFWDGAKQYLGPSNASLIGKWIKDHGKVETARAITAAQIERAVDPVAYVHGYFRKNTTQETGYARGLSVPC